MTSLIRFLGVSAVLIPALALAQTPPPGRQGGGPPQPKLSITSPAWPDGGPIPMHYSGRGDNKSPAFEFHWFTGTTPSDAPATLQSYAVIFHDVENSTARGPVDTPESVQRRVALDVEYIQRQSFWLDLWIMLITVPCLLGDSDAVR